MATPGFEGERRTAQHIQRFTPSELQQIDAERERVTEAEGTTMTRSRLIRRALTLYFDATPGAIDGTVPKSARVEIKVIRKGRPGSKRPPTRTYTRGAAR
jgi:hypothetical protein